MTKKSTKRNGIRPLGDRVLVRRIEESSQTSSGLFMPDNAREKPMEGEVVAVGRGRRENGVLTAVDVAKGDRVIFGKYSGVEIKYNSEELLILREEEILAAL